MQATRSLIGQFEVSSPATDEYNCIAWAAAEVDRWWWPNPYRFWPTGVPRQKTVEAFTSAFQTVGYEPCANGSLEEGVEKLALYGLAGVPKHMARQLPSGRWTSKLGESWDICHFEVDGVAGLLYGEVICFFARRIQAEEENSGLDQRLTESMAPVEGDDAPDVPA